LLNLVYTSRSLLWDSRLTMEVIQSRSYCRHRRSLTSFCCRHRAAISHVLGNELRNFRSHVLSLPGVKVRVRVKCEVRGARCEEGIVQGSVRGGTRLVGYKQIPRSLPTILNAPERLNGSRQYGPAAASVRPASTAR